MDTPQSPDKWQERFDFFEKNGCPASKEYMAALKELNFKKRILINVNIFAFFFGVIYFFCTGLWKKGLILLVSWIAFIFALSMIEDMAGAYFVDRMSIPLSIFFGFICSRIANYAHYLKKTKGIDNWNPFEGILFK
ncbi:DUF2628 domain-containing protein [Xenorhabdus szentirmaii]|uniref:Membrane protein n=1 Tax=Xenorhabdus szentirmaii DSM 16338 TaxID=1427518 RepID=W1IWY3_9GAMM|nr:MULTISPECIES: DUF2628 domain-containing protein [Xenorhabdus]MBD2791171.1 DUF2628 domain-containing protein [Xenorhabdus sp. CUL]MBD2805675.1 DUF2628 domain-containing protein [Xenorhabdus sp. ZM]MBD2821076.1 DUF2628 domain-containing protein [Xenorhabdus sp. 42]MBD2824215.1 DUF2628 domain-containing protein [Xenorhabdus sp. 5]PHM35126.1 hypothetical protein Xsze_01587 [Xenorhabdus szentirmaii DSM 16338]